MGQVSFRLEKTLVPNDSSDWGKTILSAIILDVLFSLYSPGGDLEGQGLGMTH